MAAKDIFQPDNLFSEVMTKIFDILLLNFLWLVCSLPVVTFGASTTALYYMMMKLVRDEESGIVKGFFKAFRENFRQAFAVTGLFLVFAAVLAVDFHVLGQMGTGSASVMYGGCCALLVFGTAVFGYAFPLLAKFDNTVKNTLFNGAKIAATHLPCTAVMVVINAAPLVWFLLSPDTFSIIFWIWVFAGEGLSAFVISKIVVKVFDEFIPEKGNGSIEEI